MNIVIFPHARGMRNDKKHPKNFPYWAELIQLLEQDGHDIIQVGIEGELQLVSTFHKNLSLSELGELIKSCDTWIGIDSFGQHFCWDLGKKGIAIFGQSDPLIFGHSENINILKDRKYLREKQFWLWEQAEANDDAFVSAQEVYDIFNKHFNNING